LIVKDITDEHLKMVKAPPHGYGRYMNPCIDCHAMMVRMAGEIMRSEGFDVVATGEVLGERPMSQNLASLNIVERDAGMKGYLLRPLSAKLLEPTIPELDGRIDRTMLLAIEGRSRKPQFELAKKYEIKSFEQPAGGCRLTDPEFSKRLEDLFKFNPNANGEDVELLKLGRHFRLPTGAKVIVGRDEKDNMEIEKRRKNLCLIRPKTDPGPSCLLIGSHDEKDLDSAIEICAAFSDLREEGIIIEIVHDSKQSTKQVKQVSRQNFEKLRI
ncbi:MAG: tRNA 4-thiouridine(8) synthase ThiI, partial [Pseudomonadota bacterium]